MAEPEEKKEEKKEPKAGKKKEKAEGKDFERMTVSDLREYALKNHPDITGVHAMRKEELLKAIYQARGETPPEKKKAAEAKKVVDKATIKKKIRLLMAEKEKLLEDQKNRKALIHLRRKIKRLRRQTRRQAA